MESKDTMFVTVHGENRVQLVQKLRAAADNLDGAPADTTGKPARSPQPPKAKAAPPAAVAEEEDDDFKSDDGGAEPAGFDDDAPAAESFEEEAAPPKAAKPRSNGKAKKITLDDVNDACKAHAAAKGRPATLQVLQKKFKTQSVTALKPEQYEACISAMAVN